MSCRHLRFSRHQVIISASPHLLVYPCFPDEWYYSPLFDQVQKLSITSLCFPFFMSVVTHSRGACPVCPLSSPVSLLTFFPHCFLSSLHSSYQLLSGLFQLPCKCLHPVARSSQSIIRSDAVQCEWVSSASRLSGFHYTRSPSIYTTWDRLLNFSPFAYM